MTTQAMNKAFAYASTLSKSDQEGFAGYISYYISQGDVTGTLMDKIIEEYKEMK